MSRAKHGLPPWIQAAIPPGPPIGCEYRVPEGHPCYGCRMYTNPCLYPCNKFRDNKISKTADELAKELEDKRYFETHHC